MGFSRHEDWSGLPFPPPRGLPDPGIETTFPEGGFFTTELLGSLTLNTLWYSAFFNILGNFSISIQRHLFFFKCI